MGVTDSGRGGNGPQEVLEELLDLAHLTNALKPRVVLLTAGLETVSLVANEPV